MSLGGTLVDYVYTRLQCCSFFASIVKISNIDTAVHVYCLYSGTRAIIRVDSHFLPSVVILPVVAEDLPNSPRFTSTMFDRDASSTLLDADVLYSPSLKGFFSRSLLIVFFENARISSVPVCRRVK